MVAQSHYIDEPRRGIFELSRTAVAGSTRYRQGGPRGFHEEKLKERGRVRRGRSRLQSAPAGPLPVTEFKEETGTWL
jgi:hypothetical protein